MTNEVATLVSLRVFNKTRSCIYAKKADNGVWCLPTTKTPNNLHDFRIVVPDIVKSLSVSEDFKVVSALAMLDVTFENPEKHFRTIIYDLKYVGSVLPENTSKQKGFTECKWFPRYTLCRQKVAYPLKALLDAMEEKECLR